LFFFVLLPPPASSTLFPYTTLFRSGVFQPGRRFKAVEFGGREQALNRRRTLARALSASKEPILFANRYGSYRILNWIIVDRQFRSEEHTSELQSRENLVCRLLLEKK